MVDLFIPYSNKAYFFLYSTRELYNNYGKLASLLKG